MAFCKGCNARIEWHKTPNDKSIPLDPEPHPQGNLTFDARLDDLRLPPGPTAPSRTENEHEMLGHLADEIGVGRREARLRLPIAREPQERPKTRADCLAMSRPCPFVGCRHHLAIEINPTTGAIQFRFPGVDIEDMPQTCSLDVADAGGATLEEIGVMMGITRERVRQLEEMGVRSIQRQRARELGVESPSPSLVRAYLPRGNGPD